MKALVYRGPGLKAIEDRPKPEIQTPGDAIVKIEFTTICGTDLHILKGHVATCVPGRILGNEGVGVVRTLTGGRGVDTAIEAVGIPATFSLCQDLVAAGGVIANIGVHGEKVDLHLERLWSHNISITTRLVDTVSTPMLLKTVQAGKMDPTRLITHRFSLDQILDAYDVFGRATETGAVKVIISS